MTMQCFVYTTFGVVRTRNVHVFVLFHSAFVIIACERINKVGPVCLLLLMRCDFPIDNILTEREPGAFFPTFSQQIENNLVP